MKTITLISHWFGEELNLRVSPEIAEKLLDGGMDLINEDCDRLLKARQKPLYLTIAQVYKVTGRFKGGSNYFERVTIKR